MKSLNDCINTYKTQLEIGDIKKAYKGLMDFMMHLKNHFKKTYSTYAVSSGLYQGFMDFSFFSFAPPSLKKEKLKVVILFNHETFRFEAWLCGVNKQVQAKVWEIFKGSDWDKYPLSATGENAIMEHVLVASPDFDHPALLTKEIEQKAIAFVNAVAEVFK